MKTLSKLIAVAWVALTSILWVGNAQAADQVKKPKLTRSLQHFTKVNVEGNVRLIISNGNNDQLLMLSKEHLTSKQIKVEVKDGVLSIKSTMSLFAGTPQIVVFAKDLQAIEACKNVQIESLSTFNAIELSITLDQESSANLTIDVYELYSQVTLGSKLMVKGSAEVHNIKTDQSACIDGSSFIVNNYNAELNGICDFKAVVKDQFNYKNGTPAKMSLAGQEVSISSLY
ncbi:hypothetical protein D3C72_905990 [compost metagenome]